MGGEQTDSVEIHLHLGNGEALKASIALSAGIARMGETCGALTGGIMAIGLVLGREELDNIQAYKGYDGSFIQSIQQI